MSELYMLVTIISRKQAKSFGDFYTEMGLPVSVLTVGYGTASNEVLDYFGLDGSEKCVMFHFVTDETWKCVKKELRSRMHIDYPGFGIAFQVPLSSIGGRKTLKFLTTGQHFENG